MRRPCSYAFGGAAAGVLAAALLVGCAAGPSRGGCDVSSLGPGAGDSLRLVAGVHPTRVQPGSLRASADGRHVVAGCSEGVCRWDARGGAYEVISKVAPRAISPDLSLVASVTGCSDITVSDLAGEHGRRLTGLPDPEVTDASPVDTVAFSPDSRLVAGVGLEDDLIVWSAGSGDQLAATDFDDHVRAVSFSPDGKRLAVAFDDHLAVLETDPDNEGNEVGEGGDLSAASGSVEPVWSPDGRWIAAATSDGYAALWDTRTYRKAEALPGYPVGSLAFAPDSAAVALTGADDTRLRLWTPEPLGGSGGDARDLSQTVPAGSTVVFGPSGKQLYTASAEDGIAAWDARTGKPAVRFGQPAPSEIPRG